MYAKLFARITESSLMEEPINVRYTFAFMLAIADPEGYVIGTDIAIARRLNMPLDEFLECLGVLMSPDQNSNSKAEDGRRVTVSDTERGYHLVNYRSYRDLKDPVEKREYMREYMRKYRNKKSQDAADTGVTSNCKPCKQSKLLSSKVTHVDAEGEDIKARSKATNVLGKYPDFKGKKITDPEVLKEAIDKLQSLGHTNNHLTVLAAIVAERVGKKPGALFVSILQNGFGKFSPSDGDNAEAKKLLNKIMGYERTQSQAEDE